MAKGIDFEIRAREYLRFLFEYLGFEVPEGRQQEAGTQNGFDIIIRFLDPNGKLRNFCFECKDYTSKLYDKDIIAKVVELNTSRYHVDGFIVLSPHVDISNIFSNIREHLPGLVKFPIACWTPEASVKEYFSLEASFYEFIYGEKLLISEAEREKTRKKLRSVVLDMLRRKDELSLENTSTAFPKELTLSIPRIHQDNIIGREEELEGLHTLLFNNKQVVVVNGIGGVGKTTLAQGYLGKYYEEYRHIAWVTQLTRDISNDIVNAEGLIGSLLISRQDKDINQVFKEILQVLKSFPDGPNLLVLDNADELLAVQKNILPSQPGWHTLVTSRHNIEGFYPKELDFLSPHQSILLFRKHCSRIKNEEQIAELVKAVDYHTLTIEILAKTAALQKVDLETLKNAIKDDLRSNVYVNHKGGKIDRVFSYLSSIFNFSELKEDEAWLMKQFICLPADFHNWDTLKELLKNEILAETLERLVELGWLIKNAETEAYKLHLVVKEVAVRHLSLSLKDIEGLLNKMVDYLMIDQSKDNPIEKFRWIPYGQALLNNFQEEISFGISTLQNNLAMVFEELGDYNSARELLEHAVRLEESALGPDHPSIIASYSNLGLVLQDLGEYSRARELLEKAMRLAVTNLGSDHPTTTMSYSNVASVLQSLGDYDGAQELLEKTVHSNEVNLDPDHPHTAISYSNLAVLLIYRGDYNRARELLEKAIRSNEATFGPNHPNTLINYLNLAFALDKLNDNNRAKELAGRSLSVFKKILPEGHPNIQHAQMVFDSISS